MQHFPSANYSKASWDFMAGGRLKGLVAVLKLADLLLWYFQCPAGQHEKGQHEAREQSLFLQGADH